MRLCGKTSRVHGSEPCPREYGHSGQCMWWIPFEVGNWRVVVYEGLAPQRRRVCRGGFTSEPSAQDVYQLLLTVGNSRRREMARRGIKRCIERSL